VVGYLGLEDVDEVAVREESAVCIVDLGLDVGIESMEAVQHPAAPETGAAIASPARVDEP
jgi:hypothetical protein